MAGKVIVVTSGKGGVGKTTCSAATALHYASTGKRTLLISSDLTPSLSDILETPLGPAETTVPGIPNLSAFEISTDEVMRRWKAKFGRQIYDAAAALVDMPYDELVDYVAMAPGLQEEFMLDHILAHVRDGPYDMIVWDTAPAGDTLRLLDLPRRFLEHLRTAPRFYFKAQGLLGRGQAPFLQLIESWTSLSQEVADFFRAQDQVEFIVVTIPEALGVYQSRRVAQELTEHGIPVRHVVVNAVVTQADGEFLRERMKMQAPYLAILKESYGEAALTAIPLLPYEVKGMARLREIERWLFR